MITYFLELYQYSTKAKIAQLGPSQQPIGSFAIGHTISWAGQAHKIVDINHDFSNGPGGAVTAITKLLIQ